MKKLFILFAFVVYYGSAQAQESPAGMQDTIWKRQYREAPAKINALVHTKLEVSFDYDKSYLYGKAWITLKPYFYPTDSLTLDAKGMDIKNVSLIKGTTRQPLKYTYDSMQLHIKLGATFSRHQQYTVYIDYIAKPDELKAEGSAAITDAKGLYFVNPRGEEKDKPTQIWTQGETEATSVWCPTIDKPNQKTTQEISMTVPSKYVTLSNGKLMSQKKNADGTRTDIWKMDLPHAPYLFFMGVGDFSITKDQYKGKEVSYYVEKEYAPVARKIFGHTPEMMAFFAKLLNYEYPWNKYAQIVGRDYVSGAMENTTAVIHQVSAQQDARELVDGNIWENTIAHELFHHWFGNLVTTESWSNLTLNESFANYSEYLWLEHKYGKDAADAHHTEDMHGYIQSESEHKDLVRFFYPNKENMFDAVSYNKGGRILHMLRKHVGDSAFFKSLNVYLTKHKFGAAEAHQLRLAFEEVTGKDLNWFWNQWYFGGGHPNLEIDYQYLDSARKVHVIVKQTQSGHPFRLPISVDIYNGQKKNRHQVWLSQRIDTLTFSYTEKPDLINVDADKMLLAEKKDNKSLANFIHQFKYAGSYADRMEAIDFAATSEDALALDLLKEGLKDKYYGLRSHTISRLPMIDPTVRVDVEPLLAELAGKDPKSTVRAAAIGVLATYQDEKYKPIFLKNLNDSSYSVAGASLEALMMIDRDAAVAEADKIAKTKVKGKLRESLTKVLMLSGNENGFETVVTALEQMPVNQAKLNLLPAFGDMLINIQDPEKIKRAIDMIVEFRDAIPAHYGIAPHINGLLKNVISRKEARFGNEAAAAQTDYIREKTQ